MIALLLALFAADPEPTPIIKAIASAPWTHAHLNGKKAVVIRKVDDLAKLQPYVKLDVLPRAKKEAASNELAANLKMKAIDWDKQMVVIILAGAQRSGGYRIEVTGLKVEKGTLTVSWKLLAPAGFATAAITYPSLAVLVPKHTGKVVFDPPLK
jgi:hypothetical protein